MSDPHSPTPQSDAVRGSPQETEALDPAPSATSPSQHKPPDPTRYGDWEKNGRCIDF